MWNGWPSWDLELLKAVNLGLSHPVLTRVMLAVTEPRNWFPVLGAGVLALFWAGRSLPRPRGSVFQRRNPRAVVLGLLLCVALADPLAYRIKVWTGRLRPCRDEEVAALLDCRVETMGRLGFPSNHAANSGALAVFVALTYPPLAVPALASAFLVGFSRVFLAVHYPLDVLVGWGLGGLVGLAVFLALRRPLRSMGLVGFANRFRRRIPVPEIPPGGDWVRMSWSSLDGHRVSGWHLPGGPFLLVFVHGLGGNATSRAELAETLRREHGWGALLVPLRGDEGHPVPVTGGGVTEVHDVLGALAHAGALGFAPGRCILYGVSMGGSAVLKAAALAGDLSPGVILAHGAFTAFFRAAENRLGRIRSAVLKRLLPGGAARDLAKFDPGLYGGLCPCPDRIQYITGGKDTVCPPAMGKELMSRSEGSRRIVLPDDAHPVRRNALSPELLEVFRTLAAECRGPGPSMEGGVCP